MKVIPKEVKKTITNSREIKELRASLKLSSLQKEVLLGTILGDGCLTPNYWGKNYRLQICHCKKQKQLVTWKHNIFKNFTLSKPSYCKNRKAWEFKTISHPEFTEFYKIFYPQQKKLIPSTILPSLTPLSLAVWFMDDGARGPRQAGFTLNSQSYTYDDNLKLKTFLEKRFELRNISIHKDKNNFRLYIRKNSEEQLIKLVKPYILSCMQYKLS